MPYIRIPIRKILAPNQAKNSVNRRLITIEIIIWEKDGTATQMRINIRVGVKRGKREAAITKGVLGFWVTIMPIIKGIISR